jgi:protein involved in ribonucleotide reduction
LQDGRMVFSCYHDNTVSFMNKEGVELFHIDEDKTGYRTYDTVYITDTNSVAVSSLCSKVCHQMQLRSKR